MHAARAGADGGALELHEQRVGLETQVHLFLHYLKLVAQLATLRIL